MDLAPEVTCGQYSTSGVHIRTLIGNSTIIVQAVPFTAIGDLIFGGIFMNKIAMLVVMMGAAVAWTAAAEEPAAAAPGASIEKEGGGREGGDPGDRRGERADDGPALAQMGDGR